MFAERAHRNCDASTAFVTFGQFVRRFHCRMRPTLRGARSKRPFRRARQEDAHERHHGCSFDLRCGCCRHSCRHAHRRRLSAIVAHGRELLILSRRKRQQYVSHAGASRFCLFRLTTRVGVIVRHVSFVVLASMNLSTCNFPQRRANWETWRAPLKSTRDRRANAVDAIRPRAPDQNQYEGTAR